MIKKEMFTNRIVMEELAKMVVESEIMKEDDKLWPVADRDGRQELEIIWNGEHICFSVPSYIVRVMIYGCLRPRRLLRW